MDWRLILTYTFIMLFVVGCTTYSHTLEGLSKSVNPGAHQAYERSVECQKQGKTRCD